jgi:hypothetical protein
MKTVMKKVNDNVSISLLIELNYPKNSILGKMSKKDITKMIDSFLTQSLENMGVMLPVQ